MPGDELKWAVMHEERDARLITWRVSFARRERRFAFATDDERAEGGEGKDQLSFFMINKPRCTLKTEGKVTLSLLVFLR